MPLSTAFRPADDLIGYHWGVPTFSRRGDITELVTTQALDITAACTKRVSGVKRVALMAARTQELDSGLIQLAQWLSNDAKQLIIAFNPRTRVGISVSLPHLAQMYGLAEAELEQAIRIVAEKAGISLG